MPKSQRGRGQVEKLRRWLFRRDWEKAETAIGQIPEGRLLPNLHVDQEKWSVLHVAAMVNAPPPLLEKILQVVDVSFCMQKDANGNNPLHKLCKSGTNIEAMRLLALAYPQALHEQNAEEEKTPFDMLLDEQKFNPSEIALIIADIAAAWTDGMYTTNSKGENLLHRAVPYCSKRGTDVARVILGAAPGLLETTDDAQATPIHCAARQKGPQASELISFLAHREGDCALDLEDCRGRTPLHEACSSGNREVIDVLVEKYPDALELEDESGMTPLALFRRRYRRHFTHYVNRHVTIADMSMTLLTRAPVRGNDAPSLHSLLRNEQCTLDIARFLIIALPDQALVKDETGDLPLHFICCIPNVDGTYYEQVVEALLTAYPAACRIPNHLGMLPLQLMVLSGKSWSNGMRLVFLEHPAAAMDLALNSYALCKLLERVGGDPTRDAMFRFLRDAPNLLQT